jgi:RNA polymerase sigma-70 factor (ECF subfamily)
MGMNEVDREVLALRHFESLSNGGVAKRLGMTEQAARTAATAKKNRQASASRRHCPTYPVRL